MSGSYLLQCCLEHYPNTRLEVVKSCAKECFMTDAVLLKPVQERGRSGFNIRLFDHDHTHKVRVYSTGPQVGPNGYVGIVTGAVLWVVYPTEPLIEEIIKALVDVVCLAHDDGVAFDS